MRTSIFLATAFWAICPVTAQAQSDPNWSRREMERMQAEQERFNAQVERQRAEQERFNVQQERQAAEVARQRSEQERRAARQRGGGTSATGAATPMSADETARPSQPITFERLNVVFQVATHVCPIRSDPAFDNALSLMSDDEGALLFYFCTVYILGQAAGEQATKATRGKQ